MKVGSAGRTSNKMAKLKNGSLELNANEKGSPSNLNNLFIAEPALSLFDVVAVFTGDLGSGLLD